MQLHLHLHQNTSNLRYKEQSRCIGLKKRSILLSIHARMSAKIHFQDTLKLLFTKHTFLLQTGPIALKKTGRISPVTVFYRDKCFAPTDNRRARHYFPFRSRAFAKPWACSALLFAGPSATGDKRGPLPIKSADRIVTR